MIRHHIHLVLFVAVLATSRLYAQEVPVVGFDEAMRLFSQNNVALRLSRARADQAAGLALQSRAFPNPSLNATHEPLSSASRSYSETYVTASQRFELSGSRSARSEAGGRRSQAARHLVRADSLRAAFDVQRAFVEALRAQETRAMTERIARVFRAALQNAAVRYASGDMSRYAYRRIEIERARYETLLVDADLEVGSAQRALALLIAPSGEVLRYAAGPLPADVPPVVGEAMLDRAGAEERAELAAAQEELEAERAQARLMRAERVPDVTATGGFKSQSDGLKGAFLGLSLPVPVFDRGAGSVDAADAAVRAAEERLNLTRRQLDNDVRQTIDTYRTLQRRIGIRLQGHTGAEGDILDIALVSYEEGEMELLELLDAADALHLAQAAETRLQADSWIAYFDLERALGGFGSAAAQEDGR